jgi:hypothetical protein
MDVLTKNREKLMVQKWVLSFLLNNSKPFPVFCKTALSFYGKKVSLPHWKVHRFCTYCSFLSIFITLKQFSS